MNKFEPYFNKLNIKPKTPSLELVKELQKKHLETFSFNNIAVLLGEEISLDIDDIIEKIVRKNLGGYCFEHNALMYEVLKSLGFNVRILVAKVVNNQEVDVPRTHRITLLEWEGEQYSVDVGFGSMSPKVVLNIHDTNENGGYKVVPYEHGIYQVEVLTPKDYFSLYRFDLAHYTEADCVMGNFYSSQYPNAVFVNNFLMTLKLSAVTLSFRNGVYHRIFKDNTELVDVKNVEQLKLIMNEEFKIPLELVACERLFETYNGSKLNKGIK